MRRKITKIISLYIVGLCCIMPAWSQQTHSLSMIQAQELAIKNSYVLQNSRTDILISKKKIWETTAMGLPQANAQIQYQDMLDIPTTLLPDFISPSVYGVLVKEGVQGRTGPVMFPSSSDMQFFPAKFGTQHNASIGGTISQLIFSGQYIVGLQAAKVFHELSEQSYKKSEIDVKSDISNTYLLVLTLRQNTKILESSYETMNKLFLDTKALNKQGFVEETTVDQLQINVLTIQNAIQSIQYQAGVAEQLLKYQIGIDLNDKIELTDNLDNLLGKITLEPVKIDNIDVNNLIDFSLINTQEKLQRLNLKREQSTFLPTVSGFYTYQKKAMRNEFDIFETGKDWYPTSIIGVNIDIPIFSSGMRIAKVQQQKLNLLKSQVVKIQVSEGLKLAANQASIGFNNALSKYQTEQKNKDLADKIFKKAVIKFKEGVITSTELTQNYAQFLTAQSNFISATLELLNSKTKLDKAIGKY